MPVTVRSFAKINLGLRIGALRPDGFHELRTVYQTIALHDIIRVQVGADRGSRFVVKIRAFRKMNRTPAIGSWSGPWRRSRRAAAWSIEIEKRLPVQGGLGGASGNAVAALLALERALKKELAGAGEVADCGGGWIGFAAVSGGRDGAGGRARRGGLSAAGFAADCVRGGDSRDRGLDSEGICGLGSCWISARALRVPRTN